jgi:hypothetical protein
MLRALVLLLLLANGLFFAWSRGWLGTPPSHAQREPERLAAQVNPEAVLVLPPAKAQVAVQAARAAAQQCLEAGPFTDATISAAEEALAAAQLPAGGWSRVDPAAAAVWVVFAGRYPDAPQRNAREEDLRKYKLSYERIDAPADLAPGFVLSRHGSRDDAEAWIRVRVPAALKGVRAEQLRAPPPVFQLRVPLADAEQAERLRALPPGALAGGFRPCAAKP